MSLGFPEILVILIIALVLFGPRKLPEVGRSLGRAMRELRNAARDFTTTIEEAAEERKEKEDEP
jgi:sec-independent protein translocase protein TatA